VVLFEGIESIKQLISSAVLMIGGVTGTYDSSTVVADYHNNIWYYAI
jgi:hypothetical protein